MGWIGYCFLLMGRFLLGNRSVNIVKIALSLTLIGDLMWTIVGFQLSRVDMIVNAATMAIADLIVLIKLSKTAGA